MVPNLAYLGTHERDTINPEGVTYRFLLLLAESGLDRDRELSQLTPECGMVARPFSVDASRLLADNDSNADVILD